MALRFRPFKGLPPRWRIAADWLLTIGLASAFVLVFEAKVARPYRIPTSSMEPTLHCAKPSDGCEARTSDRVIADRLAYELGAPQRGQVVVFTAPAAAAKCGPGDGGETFIKRLIGLPGDTVSERDGYVFVNGWALSEPYVDPQLRDQKSGTWHVPASRYFFLGDDRVNSCDSRIWGSVPRSNLIGPVVATYWPPNRLSFWPSGL
ncbi:MAG TPA: signal peptidase I [Gaiellaceae bacterium]|nr:signal peptidase I [Gaiellaceae bacterium]